ncbi:MAG: 50S ribosomal protein L25 [Candidatus Woesebacteria bacterium]|jgi:large subunit ribosomal protein L25
MADKFELLLQDRTAEGKAVKRLRHEGIIPGVIYGKNIKAKSVQAGEVPMLKAYFESSKGRPVSLVIGKQKHLAMIKSADFDPAQRRLRHLAFHVIKQNEKVEAAIPLVIVGEGETPAQKAGLLVMTTIDKVLVEALPKNLPESIKIDGSQLESVGQQITVADLDVPNGVTMLTDSEQVVAMVHDPEALQAANEAAGGEPEPEEEKSAEQIESETESKTETEESKSEAKE